MASIPQAFLVSLLALLVLVETRSVSGRKIPSTYDMKHPELPGHYDGTVLVPGLGRFTVPKIGSNPLTYNPITGRNDGSGAIPIPGLGGSTGSHNYIPGGDDTLLPGPGVEVPNPAGGGVPVPSRH